MKFKILLLTTAFILAGCTLSADRPGSLSSSSPSTNTWHQHCEPYGYCFAVPGGLQQAIGEHDVTTYYTSTKTSESQYSLQPYHLSSPCSPPIMGTSKATSLLSGTAEWGYVDYYDLYWTGDYPQGFADICRPADEDPKNRKGAAYAFCSEKNDKTVLICMTQAKNNPELAKQVFETFRWTK